MHTTVEMHMKPSPNLESYIRHAWAFFYCFEPYNTSETLTRYEPFGNPLRQARDTCDQKQTSIHNVIEEAPPGRNANLTSSENGALGEARTYLSSQGEPLNSQMLGIVSFKCTQVRFRVKTYVPLVVLPRAEQSKV